MFPTLFILVVLLAALIVIDVAAVRFGADSRHIGHDRSDWW